MMKMGSWLCHVHGAAPAWHQRRVQARLGPLHSSGQGSETRHDGSKLLPGRACRKLLGWLHEDLQVMVEAGPVGVKEPRGNVQLGPHKAQRRRTEVWGWN